jgi:hypothetical protein
MSKETSAILRAVLYHALKEDNLEDVRAAILAMCDKDDIDSVEQAIAKSNKEKESKRTNA